MKKMTIMLASSLTALSLSAAFASTGFKPVANPPSVSLFGSAGAYGIATRSGFNNGSPSMSMSVNIPGFALGAIGSGGSLGNLSLVSVTGRQGISVYFTGANTGAKYDTINFFVAVAAGTPKGVYPMVVAIENKLTGDNGTVTLTVDVR